MSSGQSVPLQCYNMGHSVHGIYLYGEFTIIMGIVHAQGHYDRGTLSPGTPVYMCSGVGKPTDNPLLTFITFIYYNNPHSR